MSYRKLQVLKITLAIPLRRCFDYLPNKNIKKTLLKPGIRVEVPFGNSGVQTGILMSMSNRTEINIHKLKKISNIIDEQALYPANHLELLQWASDYYQYPIGEVIFSTLPTLLRKNKPVSRKAEFLWRLSEKGKKINLEEIKRAPKQLKIINVLRNNPNGILHADFENNNFLPTLKTLEKKGFVEKSEFINRQYQKGEINHYIKLNADQKYIVDSIKKHLGLYQGILLYGVTGSGKTEVYIELMLCAIRAGLQTLILVPEIGLTPQLIERIKTRILAKFVVLHSSLTKAERLQAWLEARDGIASVVIGTRSAVWTPLKKPGLIIIDEEHDISYKQQDGFKYSARDVAIMRAKMNNIPIILGSATPSMESLQNVKSNKFVQFALLKRAKKATVPLINIIDMRTQSMHGAISEILRKAVETELGKRHQVLLFLNKRGFSPIVMCHDCGWVAKCSRCNIPMTYHKHNHTFLCHHCNKQIVLLKQCPECNSHELIHIGYGTERIMETLVNMFPTANILRIDRDTTRRKGAMKEMVNSINAGEADILIGTQMLAKGHDFPNLTLVGIIDTDRGLFSSDFRMSERLAQLFIQVSGRAGRADKKGKVLIQTHYPKHPLLLSLINSGYMEFAKMLLAERQQANLPPFSHLALLRAESYQNNTIQKFMSDAQNLIENRSTDIELYGPIPAPIEKRAGRFRFQLLLQSTSRQSLNSVLTPWSKAIENLPSSKKVRWSLDIDPQDML